MISSSIHAVWILYYSGISSSAQPQHPAKNSLHGSWCHLSDRPVEGRSILEEPYRHMAPLKWTPNVSGRRLYKNGHKATQPNNSNTSIKDFRFLRWTNKPPPRPINKPKYPNSDDATAGERCRLFTKHWLEWETVAREIQEIQRNTVFTSAQP